MMRNKLIIQAAILGLGIVICASLLHFKVLPVYIAGQEEIELKIAGIAADIRSGKMELDTNKTADLLLTTVDRSSEKYIVSFYVRVAIIAVSFIFILYFIGFYLGLREGRKSKC